MKFRLPFLAPAAGNPIATRLNAMGHDVAYDGVDARVGGNGLMLQVGVTSLDVAALVSAQSGVALEIARRVRDGAPLLLPDDEHTVFRVAWAADLADAIVLATQTQPEGCHGVAGREIWSLESMAHAMGDLHGERVDIVRAPAWLIAKVCPVPDAPDKRVPALLPSFSPTPSAVWMRAVLDAACSMPSPDTRTREIALARRLQRNRRR